MSAGKTLIFAFLAVLFTAIPARSDQVLLKNGDRLTGTVVRMSEDTLVFATSYSGEINISWSEVVKINTEAPIRMVLDDDTRLEGNIIEAEEGTLKFSSKSIETPVVVNLSAIKKINPEEAKPVQIQARVNVGLSVEDGNTNSENYHIDAEFTQRTENSRYRIGGEWDNEKTDDIDTVSKWLGYADFRRFFRQKWFAFANTSFENDKFADLDLRTTLGGGLGYQVFESNELNLSFEVGATYVNENFELAEDDRFAAAQWGVEYDQFFWKRAIQLFHRNFGYWSFNDSENWLIKTRQGVRSPIYKGFTATLQYNYDYDNQPSPGAATKWDWKLMFLLGYEFGG